MGIKPGIVKGDGDLISKLSGKDLIKLFNVNTLAEGVINEMEGFNIIKIFTRFLSALIIILP